MEDTKPQNLENQPLKEDKKDFELHTPKVIFNGECEHYYEEQGLDPEGRMQAKCKKCPMGRSYDNKSYILIDGVISGR